MFFCPFCGRRRFTCWPEFWPWQYDGDLFCSENCWICDSTKKQMERNGYKMAKMKKDGTPAKKPGPKAKKPTVTLMEETGAPGFTEEEVQAIKDAVPTVKVDGPLKIETKEPEKVEVVETPEPATVKGKIVDVMEHLEIKNPLQYEEFTVREVEGLFGRYRRSDVGATYIDFENAEGCVDVMSYTVKQWNAFMRELKRAAQVLGVQLDV
jgi:hypothetical protein